jgi:type-F conjugative transfer system pilin assembly protein TrbC
MMKLSPQTLRVHISVLMVSGLALGFYTNIVAHGDEVTGLISRSEASRETATHEASKLIDILRNNTLRESESVARMLDSQNLDSLNTETCKDRKESRIQDSKNKTSSYDNFPPLVSARKHPKQGELKDIPLVHEEKRKCRDLKSQGSGKCSSSLLEGMEAKQGLKSFSGAQLFIFVSQSVPTDSMKGLWNQAQRVGGKLVFRGLVGGSFKETQIYIQELGIVADIDPLKFDEFEIFQVPAFVLSQGNNHDKIVGNVSLSSFLEQSSVSGDLKKEAAELYKKLQGGQS